MTWAPFVGMFIARISKGRTIRELIGGALIAPTAIAFIWLSVFGGSALKIEQDERNAFEQNNVAAQVSNSEQVIKQDVFIGGTVLKATKEDSTRALFTLFNNLDEGLLGTILSILACILLATYFITSADSGTLVLCILDAAGDTEPPKSIRVLWGVAIAVISWVLIYAGGLQAIKFASIIIGFPISIFILMMGVTLFYSIRREPKPWAMLPQHVRPGKDQLDEPIKHTNTIN